MPLIKICHDLLQKDVEVSDGCRIEVIEEEVLKRLVTVTGIAKLSCEAWESCKVSDYMLYCVNVKAPTGVTLFHLWVRWYQDDKSYA